MLTRGEWVRAFLPYFTAALTEPKVSAVHAWIVSEFGTRQPIPAAWNPLATTYRSSGSTEYNPSHVQNYPDMTSGLNACVATLREDHEGYQLIRDLLANSDDAGAIVDAISASVWGSHPSRQELADVEAAPNYYDELGVDAPHEGHQSGGGGAQTAPAVGHPYMPELRQGMSGDPVKVLQIGLAVDADGIFGPQTDQAVRDFQSAHGLQVDGIVGPHTWTALAQQWLGVTVDGDYGPETTTAVTQYQSDQGLTVDGIAGPQTFGRLAGLR